MKNIKKDIEQIKEFKKVKENEDGTVQYMIRTDESVDIRKKLFDVISKKDITILELKKAENSLEDAFLTLVKDEEENREVENTQKGKIKKEKKEIKENNKKEVKKDPKKDTKNNSKKGGKK